MATKYWYSTISYATWSNAGHWFSDITHLVPAGSAPTRDDDVHLATGSLAPQALADISVKTCDIPTIYFSGAGITEGTFTGCTLTAAGVMNIGAGNFVSCTTAILAGSLAISGGSWTSSTINNANVSGGSFSADCTGSGNTVTGGRFDITGIGVQNILAGVQFLGNGLGLLSLDATSAEIVKGALGYGVPNDNDTLILDTGSGTYELAYGGGYFGPGTTAWMSPPNTGYALVYGYAGPYWVMLDGSAAYSWVCNGPPVIVCGAYANGWTVKLKGTGTLTPGNMGPFEFSGSSIGPWPVVKDGGGNVTEIGPFPAQ